MRLTAVELILAALILVLPVAGLVWVVRALNRREQRRTVDAGLPGAAQASPEAAPRAPSRPGPIASAVGALGLFWAVGGLFRSGEHFQTAFVVVVFGLLGGGVLVGWHLWRGESVTWRHVTLGTLLGALFLPIPVALLGGAPPNAVAMHAPSVLAPALAFALGVASLAPYASLARLGRRRNTPAGGLPPAS